MKWKKVMFMTAALMMLAVTPSGALEYSFNAPSPGDFASPTSDDTIYEHENANIDRSKNSALVSPAFGSPTSYLPGSGEYLTPNLAAGGPLYSPSLTGTVGGGTAAIPDTANISLSDNFSIPNTAFTDLTSDLCYSGGHWGTLSIPTIDLTVNVYQGTDSKSLAQGVGHFPETSIWAGNIALAGHNRGINTYFGQIHTLKLGDQITLATKLGTRTYAVTSVAKISETDRSVLSSTGENCITLLTCVRNQSAYRWCVKAVEL